MKEIELATAKAMLELDTVTLRGIIQMYTLAHLAFHQANPAFARAWYGADVTDAGRIGVLAELFLAVSQARANA